MGFADGFPVFEVGIEKVINFDEEFNQLNFRNLDVHKVLVFPRCSKYINSQTTLAHSSLTQRDLDTNNRRFATAKPGGLQITAFHVYLPLLETNTAAKWKDGR